MSGIIGGAGSKSGVIGTTELDYEEGTWTPLLISGFNSGTPQYITLSAGTKSGSYVKVGGLCSFNIYILNGTFVASAGFNNNDNILTLPFTSSSTTVRGRSTTFFQYSGGNFNSNVAGDISPNTSHMYIYKDTVPYAHSVWYQTSNASTYWIVSGTYQVAK